MRIQGIIHQQISQLKWHILACFGLVMALPIEEAVVNLKDGFGFRSESMVILSAILAPLLAGLIACSNVQGDMEEKRYIFWRSKPANVKLLIALKFFIGLVISLIILACPITFGFITGAFSMDNIENYDILSLILISLFLTIMTYSLCFGCNVLVRSTARSWLIGILLVVFLLVLPFILPLNYRDYFDIFATWWVYLIIVSLATTAAFILSLIAAQRDWHLKTNLKGLLWVGAGLVFALLMLFSSQVANIKVLDEKEIEPLNQLASEWSIDGFRNYISTGGVSGIDDGNIQLIWETNPLDYDGEKVTFRMFNYIQADNNKISLKAIESNPENITFPLTKMEGYESSSYPYRGRLIKNIGNNLYSFQTITYFRREQEEINQKIHYTHIYEKLFLRCYKFTGKSWQAVNELDISNCITDNTHPYIAMRLIGDKLIVFVNKSFVEVDVRNPENLKTINTKLDVLKYVPYFYRYDYERGDKFTIPMVPIEGIDIEEKIRLSIDRQFCFNYWRNNIFETSIVDIHNETISFFLASYSHNSILRFEVTGWDENNIHCELKTSRPLTILEGITGASYSRQTFVKNGKLYCWDNSSLMVFDIRSSRGFRKLGHFVRMDYTIEDIAVLNDGNILLYMRWDRNLSNFDEPVKNFLCLLKNPG